jgi:hypothetical protein
MNRKNQKMMNLNVGTLYNMNLVKYFTKYTENL